ncbi:MAG: YihY/virulence factor BrkB family protein [Cytophagaceae bacterium]
MIKKVRTYVENHEVYKQSVDRLGKVMIGYHKVPFLSIVKIFIRKLQSDSLNIRARAITYSFFLSIFPSIIFIFTLIPLIPIADLDKTILSTLQNFMPESMYQSVEETISDIIKIPRKGLLSFGFLFAIYNANNGIMSLMETFNDCYKTIDNRSFLKKIGISFLIIISTIIIFAGGSVLQIIFNFLIHASQQYFEVLHIHIVLLFLAKYVILFLIFLINISVLYYFAPAIHERWKFFSPGSIIASILCFLFTVGFNFYINNFNSYNKVYGSIGVLIGILLWLYITNLVILVGFQINASIDIAKSRKRH